MVKVVLSVLLLVSPYSFAAIEEAESEFEKAYDQYIDEAKDYNQTLQESESEIRKIRQIALREKYERRLRRLEGQLLESNRTLIAEMEKNIKQHGMHTLDDLLLMRLSNLYFKREQFIWGQKQKKYNEQIELYLSGKRKTEPVASKPNLNKAIYYAKELLKRYPSSPLGDNAHYLISISLEDMGYNEKAAIVYKRFLKYHSGSPLADEIMWRLGEYHFERKELEKAAYQYNQIVQLNDSEFRMKALYKLGASYFGARNFPKSRDYFVSLFNETKDKTFGSAENLTFYEDSLEYLGILYAKGFKIPIKDTDLAKAVLALTRLLQREARDNDARLLVYKFLQDHPMTDSLPLFGSIVVGMYSNVNDIDAADKVRQMFLAKLTKNEKWWNQNADDKTAIFRAQDFLEKQLLEGAQYQVEKAIETGNSKYYKVARSNYASFISKFEHSPLEPQARFELAQIEYQLKNYKSAGYHFEKVADNDSAIQFQREAAYGYLWSEAKRVGFEINDTTGVNLVKSPADTQKGRRLKLSSAERVFLRASRYYIEKYPHGERTQKILYKVAELYFKKNRFDLAEIANRRIIADRANSSLTTLKSLVLSAEINNLQNRWHKVRDRVGQIRSLALSFEVDSSSGFEARLSSDRKLKDAIKMEANGEYASAAGAYESIGFSRGYNDISDEVRWRAAVLYRKTGEINRSNANLSRIKGKGYQDRVAFLRAANNQRLLKFKPAAQAFEAFAKKFPKSPLSGEAVLAASVLYEDINKPEKAASLLEQYAKSKNSRLLWYLVLDRYAETGNIAKVKSVAQFTAGYGAEAYIRAQNGVARAAWIKGDAASARNACKVVGERLQKIKKSDVTAYMYRAQRECRYFRIGPTDEFLASSDEYVKTGHGDLVAQAYIDRGKVHLGRNENREASENFLKAWSAAGRNFYTPEGKLAYSFLVKTSTGAGASKMSLADWSIALGEDLGWGTFSKAVDEFQLAKSECLSGRVITCINSLKSISAEADSLAKQKSILKASFLGGLDISGEQALKTIAQLEGWTVNNIALAMNLRLSHLLTEDHKNKLLSANGGANITSAQAFVHLENQNISKALQQFQKTVVKDPTHTTSYLGISELLYQSQNFHMANKVVTEGFRNNPTSPGMEALSIILSSYTDDVLYSKNNIGEDFRVIYAKAFNDLIQNRPKRSRLFVEKLDPESGWSGQLVQIAKVLGYGHVGDAVVSKNSRQSKYLTGLGDNLVLNNRFAELEKFPINPVFRDMAGNSPRLPAKEGSK